MKKENNIYYEQYKNDDGCGDDDDDSGMVLGCYYHIRTYLLQLELTATLTDY